MYDKHVRLTAVYGKSNKTTLALTLKNVDCTLHNVVRTYKYDLRIVNFILSTKNISSTMPQWYVFVIDYVYFYKKKNCKYHKNCCR